MSHTPWPWIFDGGGLGYIRSGDPLTGVTVARGSEGRVLRPEDGRLIAAAPDLLAALKEAENELVKLNEYVGGTWLPEHFNYKYSALAAVRAAIAKAEGRE